MTARLLVYGANGYTGELIARAAAAQGMNPVLAGRSAGPVVALAQEDGGEQRRQPQPECAHDVSLLQDRFVIRPAAGRIPTLS